MKEITLKIPIELWKRVKKCAVIQGDLKEEMEEEPFDKQHEEAKNFFFKIIREWVEEIESDIQWLEEHKEQFQEGYTEEVSFLEAFPGFKEFLEKEEIK